MGWKRPAISDQPSAAAWIAPGSRTAETDGFELRASGDLLRSSTVNSSELIAPPRPRFGLQLLRGLAVLGLATGFSFVADLFVLSLFPQSQEFINHLLNGGLPVAKANLAPVLTLLGLTLLAFCYAGWRLLSRPPRSLVYSGLLIASVLVADMAVMAFVWPGITDPLTDLMTYGKLSDLGFIVCLAGFIPMAVFAALCRLRPWRWIGGSAIALGLILGFLAMDDAAINRPITFAQISPAFPGAEASYNVLMRYGKDHPLGKKFRQPMRIFKDGPFVDATKPAEWPAWLARHRGAVETDWAELAPLRAWIGELNTYDRIGDLMPADIHAEIITFGPLRSYSHNVCEMAGLQAVAGHGDEAIATLLPLLQVSRKLEPSARSLVRAMLARVMQRSGLSTARFVLDTAPVSPAMRARLAESLALGIGGEDGVRHLLAIENAFFVGAGDGLALGDFGLYANRRPGFLRQSLNLASPFLYHRYHTANLREEFVASLQTFAARRDMDGFGRVQSDFLKGASRPTFSNFMGTYLMGATVPAYTKVVEAYWKIEDSRTTLLARLAKS